MRDIKLTPRLLNIAKRVTAGARVADVGTDHGYLPLYLLQKGIIPYAVASDLREGPLSCAKANAVEHRLHTYIDFRLAPGLDAVAPEECDTITVAGMGGETIAHILDAAPWTRDGAHTLLLQPMTRIADLRHYLWCNGYNLYAEHICREERRFYILICAKGGGYVTAASPPSLTDCYISPALLCDPLAGEYLNAQLQQARKVLNGMEHSQSASNQRDAQQHLIQILQQALEGLK